MSKVYYDHLLAFDEIEKVVKKYAKTQEEKEELWGLIDEIIHHKALGFVLDNLDKKHHEEFLEIFHKCPHDEIVIFSYLKEKTNLEIERQMQDHFKNIVDEIKAVLV